MSVLNFKLISKFAGVAGIRTALAAQLRVSRRPFQGARPEERSDAVASYSVEEGWFEFGRSFNMARGQDFPSSRNRSVETGTMWVLAMLGLGIIAALLLIAVVPDGERTTAPNGATEQVVPNTPPPVRTE